LIETGRSAGPRTAGRGRIGAHRCRSVAPGRDPDGGQRSRFRARYSRRRRPRFRAGCPRRAPRAGFPSSG